MTRALRDPEIGAHSREASRLGHSLAFGKGRVVVLAINNPHPAGADSASCVGIVMEKIVVRSLARSVARVVLRDNSLGPASVRTFVTSEPHHDPPQWMRSGKEHARILLVSTLAKQQPSEPGRPSAS